MTSGETTIEFAHDLRFALAAILKQDMKCIGEVSLACCQDVVVHLQRDIDRLYAVHQKLVHPSKHIAYAAFWIRKVKPVSSAYPITEFDRAKRRNSPLDEGKEVSDVNERICLFYTLKLLNAYIKDGHIETPKGSKTSAFLQRLHRVFVQFVTDSQPGPALNDRFEAIIYDMRFRTFGPHHVVHLVNYFLSEASHGDA
jgi:hypothetical protein